MYNVYVCMHVYLHMYYIVYTHRYVCVYIYIDHKCCFLFPHKIKFKAKSSKINEDHYYKGKIFNLSERHNSSNPPCT